MTHAKLSRVMKDPIRPNKNMGEVYALAYAKTKSIHCLRIQDIVENANNGVLGISRKQAKLIWVKVD